MRLSEVLTLTWDKLDLKRGVIRLEAEDTKDKEAREIPIGKELHHILTSIPRDIRDRHVILHDGAPVGSINRSVKTACKNAGIVYGRNAKDGFIFHDLRHTFNTYMRKAAVEESVIMAITGHATREMFDRYNTIDAEDTHQAMRQFEVFLQEVDQTVDQKANS
jgi:integrase